MFFAMRICAILFLAAAFTAAAGEPTAKISVLDNAVLCVRTISAADSLPAQLSAAETTNHISGTVLDLRFAESADTNAASYFVRHKSPLVILVNGQTHGAAAALTRQLRAETSAVVIGNSNAAEKIVPDIVVDVKSDDEQKFQENPFYQVTDTSAPALAGTNNLLGFVDHTSEADLVRKRIKDADSDGDTASPRDTPAQPVIHDPALARAVDLLKALAALHQSHG